MSSTRLIGIGAFVLIGIVLFAIGLFMIGDRRMLFTGRVEINAEFARIAGLQSGAMVRVAGMDAGEVLAIHVPPDPGQKFRVRMRIRDNLHPLVRTDSVASIQSDGLVGARFVQIEAGTEAAPRVADGGTIVGREPWDLGTLMDEARETVGIINEAILELRRDLEETIETIGETARVADERIQQIGDEVLLLARSGNQMAEDAEAIVADIRAGRGNVGRFLTDETLYDRAAGIAEEAEQAMRNMRSVSEEALEAVAEFRGERGPIHAVGPDIRQTVAFARDAMGNLVETTEALQRHWLFRGFFRDRGFFDINRVSIEDYRAGVLKTRDRVGLRIWVHEDVLFETGPDGLEVLSEGGRTRLDLAMADFLRYPRQSPLMVEGYADVGTRDQRFLASQRRAEMVREYLIARFDLNPTRVGRIALGAEAPDSPQPDDQWSGVALALFVERAALGQQPTGLLAGAE